MKKDTLLARTGRDPARYNGMVNTPVFRTSTVIFPDREAYEARLREGRTAEWREFPIGHEVSMPEIETLGAWLRDRLPRR